MIESDICELSNKIYDRLYNLAADCKPEERCSYRFVCRGTDEYLGIKLPMIFTNVNLAGAIMEAKYYIRNNAKFNDGTRSSFLRYDIMFLLEECPGVTDINEQVKLIMRSMTYSKGTLHLEKIA